MLAISSLFAAMTIAGAFWVGVLAARRLRDWGDGRARLEGRRPLALAAGVAPSDAAVARVREHLAERLAIEGLPEGLSAPRALPAAGDRDPGDPDLSPGDLRVGDVVSVAAADPEQDGDYLVEGLVTLREGPRRRIVAVLADGTRSAWLVAADDDEDWLLLEPTDAGITGEPPRQLRLDEHTYGLATRRQAAASGVGVHGRPEDGRVATYLYEGPGGRVAWLERWGRRVLAATGRPVPAHMVTFLPGS